MSTTIWSWYTKRYTCSAFPSFEQGQGGGDPSSRSASPPLLRPVTGEQVPANQRDMVTLLLGAFAGMALSVVAHWVGSSSGSMRKNAAMERAFAQR